MKSIDYKVFNDKGQIVRDCSNYIATHELLYFIWDKFLYDGGNYKVKHKFKYGNSQTIEFVDKFNKFRHVFTNIPTKAGTIDVDMLNKQMIDIINM